MAVNRAVRFAKWFIIGIIAIGYGITTIECTSAAELRRIQGSLGIKTGRRSRLVVTRTSATASLVSAPAH